MNNTNSFLNQDELAQKWYKDNRELEKEKKMGIVNFGLTEMKC
jgi:hypothetical protein